MEEIPVVYGEDIRIYNHCTNNKEKLHIKTLCDFFNDMAEIHTRLEGIDVATLNKDGHTWMLRRIHVLIPDMPKKEEVIRLNTWCPGVEGLLVSRDYEVLVRDKVKALAHSEWMVIDIDKRRPTRPTQIMINAAARCSIGYWNTPSLFTRSEMKGVFDENEWEWESPHPFKSNFDDIDFNGHVTQSSYIQWMMNGLSFNFMLTHTLCEIDAVYDREVQPEAEVEVVCAMQRKRTSSMEATEYMEDTFLITHLICSKDHTTVHCKARSRWKKTE